MVREYKLAVQIENSSVQDVWKALWEDSEVWKSYHTDSDHEDVSVSQWQDGERRVVFSTPLKAPAFIRKIVGVEVLEVIETQLLQRQPDGIIVVESKPLLAAPGASKFTTSAFFTMREEVNGQKNCTVEVQITCTCSVWGMQTQVESMMIAQAEESMTKFLDWAERQCLQTQQNKAASPVAPAVPAQTADEVIKIGQDEFHDALEAALESASSASVASASGSQPDLDNIPEAIHAANGQLVHVAGASYEERILRYLHYMAENAGQTQKLLQSMDERIQDMTEDIATLRTAIVPNPRNHQISKQLSTPWGLYLGGTALAAVSCGFLLYYRQSKSSSSSSSQMWRQGL